MGNIRYSSVRQFFEHAGNLGVSGPGLLFKFAVKIADFLIGFFVITLFVNDRIQRKAGSDFRNCFIRITHNQTGYRDHILREFEVLGNFVRSPEGRPHVTDAEAMGFCCHRNILCSDQGICHAGQESEEVIKRPLGLMDIQPSPDAVKVRAKGQDDRGLQDHFLPGVQFKQLFSTFAFFRDDHAPTLHIARAGSSLAAVNKIAQHRIVDRSRFIQPDGFVAFEVVGDVHVGRWQVEGDRLKVEG